METDIPNTVPQGTESDSVHRRRVGWWLHLVAAVGSLARFPMNLSIRRQGGRAEQAHLARRLTRALDPSPLYQFERASV
jgi:hypothetical protein